MASRDLNDLKPLMRQRIVLFEAQLEKDGLHFHRSCVLRSQAEHDALWMRGRYPLEVVNAAYKKAGLAPITEKENEREVTWVRTSRHTPKPGETQVDAVDYYQEVKGRASYDLKVDADFDNIPDWKEFVRIAWQCGLEAGANWEKKDWPHVQWKDFAARSL
jgi:hypothetical protein